MPVVEAVDGTLVEPNHVYVGVPGGLLVISGGMLRRLDAESATAPHLPIDYFFRSLAEDQREHAICIVLSGTAPTARWGCGRSRPNRAWRWCRNRPRRSTRACPRAMATGLADYILSAADMPGQLVAYARGPYLKNRTATLPAAAFPKEPLRRILSLLRGRTSHDFASYKPRA